MEIDLLSLAIVVLASMRMTYMLVHENGFLSFALAIRLFGFDIDSSFANQNLPRTKFDLWKKSINNFEMSSYLKKTPSNHFGQMLSCFYCTSVWLSLIFFIYYYFDLPMIPLYVLAASQVNIILYNYIED